MASKPEWGGVTGGRRGVTRDHRFRKNDFDRKDRTGHSRRGRGPQEASTGRCSPGEDVVRVTDRPTAAGGRPTGRRWPPGACRLHDTPGSHAGTAPSPGSAVPPPPPPRVRWLLTYRSTNQENPRGPETHRPTLTSGGPAHLLTGRAEATPLTRSVARGLRERASRCFRSGHVSHEGCCHCRPARPAPKWGRDGEQANVPNNGVTPSSRLCRFGEAALHLVFRHR